MATIIDVLFENTGCAFAVATVFSGFVAWRISLLVPAKRQALSSWLSGQNNDGWPHFFCQLFDETFGEKYWSRKCIFRSTLASVLSVLVMWIMFEGFDLRERASPDPVSIFSVLLVALLVNALADYVSLIETRTILQHIHRVQSIYGQLFVLMADAIITGVIILFALWVFVKTPWHDGGEFSIELILGAFSTLSIFFFSTFITSIWTWLYILSTWSIRLFRRQIKDSDFENKPGQIVAALVFFWAFFGTLVLSAAMQKNENGVSPYEELLCRTSGEVCYRLSGMTDNEKDTMLYLTYACRDKVEARECFSEGLAKSDVDPERAVTFYDAACEGGEGGGCNNLGRMTAHGIGTEENDLVAAELFNRACSFNDAHGCFSLGISYARGEGVEQDFLEAFRLISRSCDIGFSEGCKIKGRMYAAGEGVLKSYPYAAKALQKACDGKNSEGCSLLGELYLGKEGITTDLTKAAQFFAQGCEGGDVHGCNNLGVSYADGRGVEADPARAAELFRRACDGGYVGGCQNLDLISENDMDDK